MEWIYMIKVFTLIICWVNYILALYRSKWDFGDIGNVGWLMAVLGWTNVVFYTPMKERPTYLWITIKNNRFINVGIYYSTYWSVCCYIR